MLSRKILAFQCENSLVQSKQGETSLLNWLLKTCAAGVATFASAAMNRPCRTSRTPKLGEADETAGGDDGEPEKKRKSASEFSAERRAVTFVPRGQVTERSELEDEGLSARKGDEQQFQAEGWIVVKFDRLGRKEQGARKDLNSEGGPSPRENSMREIGEASSTKGPAEKAEVESTDGCDEDRHA